MSARTLYAGSATGPLMTLKAPLSFWGGVDPARGTIINARHPQRGEALTGKVVAIPELIGSSSSSGILLELITTKTAPAAILLRHVDAILVVGCLAADALSEPAPPIVHLTELPTYPEGTLLSVNAAIDEAPIIRPA